MKGHLRETGNNSSIAIIFQYMNPILITILLSALGVIGDYYIKLSGAGPRYMELRWFILGAIIYGASALGWFYVMKHVKLGSLGVISSLWTILLLILVGYFFFNEKLSTTEVVGIATAIISIVLLSRFA